MNTIVISRVKIILVTILLAFGIGMVATSFVSVASAEEFDPFEQVCVENPEATVCLENSATQNGQDTEDILSGPTGIIITVANLIAIFTAVVAIIIILVSGIMMVMSSGDSAKVKSARDTILYAVVGLVVVGLARSIVIFVVNRV